MAKKKAVLLSLLCTATIIVLLPKRRPERPSFRQSLSAPKEKPTAAAKTPAPEVSGSRQKPPIRKRAQEGTVQGEAVDEKKPEWVEKLASRLGRFQEPSTGIDIVREGRARLYPSSRSPQLQRILVRYSSPHKERSFRALVDPSNGRIVRTWDKTIDERYSRRRGWGDL